MLEEWLPFRGRHDPASYDMRGKVVVVTGANTGVGYHTAKRLAAMGAEVILACRDPVKGEKARKEIGGARVVVLDLGSAQSVRDCARSLPPKIDVLVLNAGLNVNLPPKHKDFGCSTIFGVNFVAQWLLLELIEERVSKVVCLGSVMHHFANPAFDENAGYNESKLAMLLLARDLSEKGIPAVAVNPGAVFSDIWRHVWTPLKPVFKVVASLLFLTPDQGCATSVEAAADQNITSGYLAPYWHPPRHFPARSAFEFFGPFAGGRNHAYERLPPHHAQVSQALWQKCRRLCGHFANPLS